ncbi:MAG: flippase-like domain-containing protein [Pedosphaera sp.]|nr:flippase-like domain-containing protein [Pedosphaera sp.]
MKTVLRVVLLAVGLSVFVWFLQRAGLAEIGRTLASLGWLAPLALLPYSLVYLADTLGWRAAFGRGHTPAVAFHTLFRVRWCGEAVNNIVPSGYVGGEAVKVYLLHKRGVPSHDSTVSVIVGRTIQTLTQVVFIALGAAAFFQLAQPDSSVRRAMLFVLAGSVAAAAILFYLQTHGMFSLLFRLLARLRLRFPALEANRPRLEAIDRAILQFYRHDRPNFLRCAGGYLSGWLLDTLEIFLVAAMVGMPIHWNYALAIEAFIGVAKILGLLVPGAIGVQESGIALVCRLAGLPDQLGFAYAIIRRGREVFYAGVGWLLLYLDEASLKGLRHRIGTETITTL